MIHIDNFDTRKFQVINSPRSKAAMKELGIQNEDLHLKSEDDLRGMFNTEDEKERQALKACVEKHVLAHKNIVKKISDRRKELIKENEEAIKKNKQNEELKKKQLKKLEEEKKIILKRLEQEQKKKDDEERKLKAEKERLTKKGDHDKDTKKGDHSKDPKKGDQGKDQKKADQEKDSKNQKEIKSKAGLDKTDRKISPDASQIRGQSAITHKSDHDKKLVLDAELKESSILVYLDKSVHHKDQLDIDLKDRTKKDLKKDIIKMRELMKKQKDEILELAQKRNASAYKSQEALGNAKTRKIEYMYDLSRDPVALMKERQQKEMEQMMNYEIALQVIHFNAR